ncbi:MAG: alpha/beta hydrolase family protein, partial [Candidatus Latescibacterota bacterium]
MPFLKKYIHGTESPVVFSHESMQIMGVLHRPETPLNPPAVVFYHGCTGCRSEAHWLFVKLARHLAARGIMSLRFDFRHNGESEGDFCDMTLSGEISDGIRAVGYLAAECGADPARVGLLGLSMGGAVAAIVAARLREKVKSCVLVNPVAKPFD